MNKGVPELSLMAYFGMFPVSQVIEKSLFGSPKIRLMPLLSVCQYLFEIGAIIGRARRNKLHILAKMFAVPGKEQDLASYWQEQAQERLYSYGEEPGTFFDLFITTELATVGLRLDSSREFLKASQEKMPLKEAEPIIKLKGELGIGFGSKFPDLTEKMFRQQYERIDIGRWSEMKKYITTLTEQPPGVTFEEREQQLLSQLAVYVNEYFPELIKPLRLRI